MSFTIRPAGAADIDAIAGVHRAVAAVPTGLARAPEEITRDYIEHAVLGAGAVSFVAVEADGTIIGEVHACRESVALFSHVLGSLTVAVHPGQQGRGIGSRLFEILIAHARTMEPEILRIELATGAGNAGAIRLYERLGFQIEGRQPARGRYPDGRFEDDILLGMLL